MPPAPVVLVKSTNIVMAKYVMSAIAFSVCFLTTLNAIGQETLDRKEKRSGQRLFLDHCASCHGPKGLGDGLVGLKLTPPPANLLELLKDPIVDEEYLSWVLQTGGEELETAMPAFEHRHELDADDLKAIIIYLLDGLSSAK